MYMCWWLMRCAYVCVCVCVYVCVGGRCVAYVLAVDAVFVAVCSVLCALCRVVRCVTFDWAERSRKVAWRDGGAEGDFVLFRAGLSGCAYGVCIVCCLRVHACGLEQPGARTKSNA